MRNGCADTGTLSCKHLVFCSRYHDIIQETAQVWQVAEGGRKLGRRRGVGGGEEQIPVL